MPYKRINVRKSIFKKIRKKTTKQMGILKGSNENKALLPNEFLDKRGTMEKGCGVSDVVIWF